MEVINEQEKRNSEFLYLMVEFPTFEADSVNVNLKIMKLKISYYIELNSSILSCTMKRMEMKSINSECKLT
jgi:hypothetical protein